MSGTLDGAFATVIAQADAADAYTTGTATNLLVQDNMASLLASFTALIVSAEAALQTADFSYSAGVITAVTASGNAASARATRDLLLATQRALQRP